MSDATRQGESFRSLLLRHRGRTELTQRGLATHAGVSLRSVQEWEAGTKFPSAGRLQDLILALLGTGGLRPDHEAEEARELWAAVERDSSRMHTPFDEEWFAAGYPGRPYRPGLVCDAGRGWAIRSQRWR